jgi:hypothetical protein
LRAEGTAEVTTLGHLKQHTTGPLAVFRANAAGSGTILIFARLNFGLIATPFFNILLSAPNEG